MRIEPVPGGCTPGRRKRASGFVEPERLAAQSASSRRLSDEEPVLHERRIEPAPWDKVKRSCESPSAVPEAEALRPCDSLLVAAANRVVGVRPEGRDAPETEALIQPDCGLLVDAGLEAQQRNAVATGVLRKVIDQQLTILAPAKPYMRFSSPYSRPNSSIPPHPPAGAPSTRNTKKATPSLISHSTLNPCRLPGGYNDSKWV